MRLPCNKLPLVIIKETKIQLKDLQVHDMTLPVQSCGYIYNIIYIYIAQHCTPQQWLQTMRAASHPVAQG